MFKILPRCLIEFKSEYLLRSLKIFNLFQRWMVKPWKTTDTDFSAKWRPGKERRNSIMMTRHCGWCFWLVVPRGKFASTNQKHYPHLGSDASSLWNLYARFLDVISRGNQWWCHEMSAVFSSHGWSNHILSKASDQYWATCTTYNRSVWRPVMYSNGLIGRLCLQII